MQHSSLEIKDKLLRALDNEYNVLDMATVSEVISTLEKEVVTKETLEKTRIGKYVNELRKKTNNIQLAKRAKGLVRTWRKLLPETDNSFNGERVVNKLNTPVLRSTRSTSNNTAKSCELVAASQHIKNQSPSVSYDCTASPFCSSASNSPQFSFSELQGKNRSPLPSSYAPFSKTSQTNANDDVNRIDNKMLPKVWVQSKPQENCYFKPVSPPAFRVMQNSNSRTNVLENLPHPKPQSSNCAFKASAMNAVDSPGGSHRFENSVSPKALTPTFSGSSHSNLEGTKKYVANKRRMKDTNDSCIVKRSRKSPSGTNILNGTDGVEPARKLNNATLPFKNENFRKVNRRPWAKSPDLKEKLSSLSAGTKLPKVKTTQQLIDELKAKKDTCVQQCENLDSSVRTFGFSRLKSELVTETSETAANINAPRGEDRIDDSNKSDLLKANADVIQCSNDSSQDSTLQDRVLSPASDTVPSNFSVITQDKDLRAPYRDPVDIEIEQILSSLPPIDWDAANLEEEEPPLPTRKNLTSDEIAKMYEGQTEYVNGVYAYDGSWRPWQECTESLMPNGEVLKIMPFVILD